MGKTRLCAELMRRLKMKNNRSIIINHDFRVESQKLEVLESLKDKFCKEVKLKRGRRCTFPLYSYALKKLENMGEYKRHNHKENYRNEASLLNELMSLLAEGLHLHMFYDVAQFLFHLFTKGCCYFHNTQEKNKLGLF